MNWKLIGALAIGAGLLSACGAGNQTPVDSGDRDSKMDPGGGTTVKDPPPPPPTEEKKPTTPTNDAIMHD